MTEEIKVCLVTFFEFSHHFISILGVKTGCCCSGMSSTCFTCWIRLTHQQRKAQNKQKKKKGMYSHSNNLSLLIHFLQLNTCFPRFKLAFLTHPHHPRLMLALCELTLAFLNLNLLFWPILAIPDSCLPCTNSHLPLWTHTYLDGLMLAFMDSCPHTWTCTCLHRLMLAL